MLIDNVLAGARLYWLLMVSSTAGQLFLVSAALLFIGLAMRVRLEGKDLVQYLDTSLRDLESMHPHLPSGRAMVIIMASNAQMYLLSLIALPGVIVTHGPYEWLYLGVIFLLCTVIGIIAELYWNGVADHIFGFGIGTTFAYVLLLLMNVLSATGSIRAMAIPLLGVCLILLVLLKRLTRERSVHLTAAATTALWLILHALL